MTSFESATGPVAFANYETESRLSQRGIAARRFRWLDGSASVASSASRKTAASSALNTSGGRIFRVLPGRPVAEISTRRARRLERSKTGEREDILKAVFATKDRDSVLGTHSINKNGDTSLADYGAYTIENGALKFDQTVKAATQ